MAIYLHATEPTHGRPMTRELLYDACYRGAIPAEALDRVDREHLLYDLWLKGWSDVEIATHTRISTYTVVRIRERLGLAAARPEPRKAVAA